MCIFAPKYAFAVNAVSGAKETSESIRGKDKETTNRADNSDQPLKTGGAEETGG